MSKRILIISYYFSPGNLMGAIRPTKLAKFISRSGYNTKVITGFDNKWLFLNEKIQADQTLINDSRHLPIFRIRNSLIYRFFAKLIKILNSKLIKETKDFKTNYDSNNNIKSLFYNIKKNSMFIMSIIQDIDFLLMYIWSKNIKNVKIESDVIISTYGPYASHFVAYYIKRKFKDKINWIADFRDPIAQATDTNIQKFINKFIEAKICNNADSIVAVSRGYLQEITGEKFQDKKYVITNGFDIEDLQDVRNSLISIEKFIISYTGTTYNGKRNLAPLLTAINELIQNGSINFSSIEFHYAGPEKEYINKLFKEYNLENILVNHGKVTRKDSILINNNSRIIIVSTWNLKNSTGVLPGKFFESIMFAKPIIVLVNSESIGSEICYLTNKYNLGICYESENSQNDQLSLNNFLKNEYLNYINKTKSHLNTDLNSNPFNYANITKEFIKLF